MLKIAVLVSGGGTNLQAIFDAIESGKITNTKVSLVISNTKDAYALKRATKENIPAKILRPKDFATKDIFHESMLKLLKGYEIDLIVLAGYLVILDKKIIQEYKNRIINVHPSLLPSFCGDGYYGIKVHEEALKRGVKVTGATVHIVDEGTDTGPILYQTPIRVREKDTPESLQRRVMEQAEWILLPKAIEEFENWSKKIESENE